jgi:hypothetical protein
VTKYHSDQDKAMRRIHLDTDIGGDTDDLCALAMLLGWPGVELVGVTTCSDSGCLRAGLVRYVLRLAGREDVPVVAGADGSLGDYRVPPGFSDLDRYWPEPSPPGAELVLLARSVEMGATGRRCRTMDESGAARGRAARVTRLDPTGRFRRLC